SGDVPAVDQSKTSVAERAGAMVMDVLKRGLRPSDIITRESLENAIASVAATGGSTNAVLHLLAVAREFGIPMNIDEFGAISDRTPLLCDLKPGGKYFALDVFKAGGIPVIAKRLLEAGKLHPECL